MGDGGGQDEEAREMRTCVSKQARPRGSRRERKDRREQLHAMGGSENGETPRRVCVSGGTGFIGKEVVKELLRNGCQVCVLTREAEKAKKALQDEEVRVAIPAQWKEAICSCDAVINLAGEPVASRWSEHIKAEIMDSRVNATRSIVEAINGCPDGKRPSTLVSASAVGYYGTSDTATFDEKSPPGNDYLAQVCQAWEKEAQKVDPKTRLAIVRIGVTLERDGGALGRMLPAFQMFAGGPVGSGKQWFSWIHREDLVRLLVEASRNEKYQGIYNGTAPNPVKMEDTCEAIARNMGRSSWLPVPSVVLQAVLGEGAATVLEGQQVLPSRTLEAGFDFKYKTIFDAMAAILKKDTTQAVK
eukprot:scaffold776_cov347-Pavlova_lutheri.AAC.91